MVNVRIIRAAAGPEGALSPGDTVLIPDELAAALIVVRSAVALDGYIPPVLRALSEEVAVAPAAAERAFIPRKRGRPRKVH